MFLSGSTVLSGWKLLSIGLSHNPQRLALGTHVNGASSTINRQVLIVLLCPFHCCIASDIKWNMNTPLGLRPHVYRHTLLLNFRICLACNPAIMLFTGVRTNETVLRGGRIFSGQSSAANANPVFVLSCCNDSANVALSITRFVEMFIRGSEVRARSRDTISSFASNIAGVCEFSVLGITS